MIPSHSRRSATDLALIACVKAAVSAIVVWTGFRAVSDDDFARVVIAQEWAHTPKLDPSGTSWLPLPFWVMGAAMKAFGRELAVARAVSIVLGILAVVLVHRAALWITQDRRAAMIGALVAAVLPWSARLGVATVPELPTAALALLGAASTATGSDGVAPRLWGAAALCAASLSRYEPWPIAWGFAALCVYDAVRLQKARSWLFGAALLALSGQLAWIGWNLAVHGEAFHFLTRVAAYKRALGQAGSGALAYAVGVFREEPELVLVLFGASFWLLLRGSSDSLADVEERAFFGRAARRMVRPVALVCAMLLVLAGSALVDGAPTHHPERALLVGFLLASVAVGYVLSEIARRAAAARRWNAGGFFFLLAGALALGIFFVRPWWGHPASFVQRREEIAIGRDVARSAAPGEKVLLQAQDYGYFAVTAAFARPEDVAVDGSPDPRAPKPSSFGSEGALRRALEERGARYFVAEIAPVPDAVGSKLAEHGTMGLWRYRNEPALQ